MFIRRILVAAAAVLSALAIAGTTTGAVAAASPQDHAITVRAAHAPLCPAIKPDAHWVPRQSGAVKIP
jgi:hypothetical protein